MADPRKNLFLLLLLLLLLAFAGIVAVPDLDGGLRPGATESHVISRLQSLAGSQEHAAGTVVRDQDQNGVGEYLCSRDLVDIRQLSPRFWQPNEDGIVDAKNYRFRLWLPAIGGGFTPADRPHAPVDATRAEQEWRVYAWPRVRREAEGFDRGPWARSQDPRPATLRVFYVDQSGVIRATRCEVQQYQQDHEPAFDAADRVEGSDRCRDGEEWVVVR